MKALFRFIVLTGVSFQLLVWLQVGYACAQSADGESLPDMSTMATPLPAIDAPGPQFQPPVAQKKAPEGAPVIYSHTQDAGPDESVFLTGRDFSDDVVIFGPSVKQIGGGVIRHSVITMQPDNIIISPDQLEPDGLYLLWIGNQYGYSDPVRVNAPQVWWSAPKSPKPGDTVRIFGRNLARRPDAKMAFVYLNKRDEKGIWLQIQSVSKYELSVKLPDTLGEGEYQLWVHAGSGGKYGWSDPLNIRVAPKRYSTQELIAFGLGAGRDEIQRALDEGKRVKLASGIYSIKGGLIIPTGASLEGAGLENTVLQLAQEAGPHQYERGAVGWAKAPSMLVGGGDRLDYEISVPGAGTYSVWLRYRYGTLPEGHEDHEVAENFLQLVVEGKDPIPLKNTFRTNVWKWSNAGLVELQAGLNRMMLRKAAGGEILCDAIVLSRSEAWTPQPDEEVQPAPDRVVVQCEDVIRMSAWVGRLPGRAYAGIWISGDNTALRDLSVYGSSQFSMGVVISDDSEVPWVKNVHVSNVRIADLDGRQMNNSGVWIERAEEVVVENCDITGRNPFFLKGMRDSRLSGNRLSSVTRTGGNGEGYICSRTSVLHNCIIENNVFTSPYRGAGYTGRRMIWVSTGVGSVDNNIFKGNKVERTHFGGVAGTDQNVGEMVLFEWCSETAYYGHPAGVGERSVTLPREGPYLPESEKEIKELPLNENFLVLFHWLCVCQLSFLSLLFHRTGWCFLKGRFN